MTKIFLPSLLVRLLPRPLLDLVQWSLADPPLVAPPIAMQSPTLRALIARYQADIIDRLARIHAAPNPDDVQSRFLVVGLADQPGAYVQCAFDARDRRMLCEVASYVFYDVPRTVCLPPTTIAEIGRLGFTTDDSKENFRRTFRVADPPDLAAIASLLLTALYTAFDARAERALKFTAPDAPDEPDE